LESDSVLDLLIQISEGDLRRSINTLQTCSSFVKTAEGIKSKLKREDIEKISGLVPPQVIELIFNTIRKTNGYGEI
jgi:DNA polymerase III delta prime subunit